MIKSNELRIGNLVEKEGEIYVADFITINMAHNYNPIPLKPEILEKCGFIPTGLADFINGEIELWQVNNEFHYSVHDDYHISINSVHQLQNLYFALTGEELTIQL